jgi:hypothetical protein
MITTMRGVVMDVEMVISVRYGCRFVNIIRCIIRLCCRRRSNSNGCFVHGSVVRLIKNDFILCDKKGKDRSRNIQGWRENNSH